MASRSCSNSDDKETSTLCLSHFLEIAGLAYIGVTLTNFRKAKSRSSGLDMPGL